MVSLTFLHIAYRLISESHPHVEVISHIFTMGMDSEPRISTHEDEHSTPRQMKRYIQRVGLICRRWNSVTRWQTNPHFWETYLHLRMKAATLNNNEEYEYCFKAVTRFRQALRSAQDGDIRLHWGNSIAANQMTEKDYVPWSRIYMHCVAMLANYSSQINAINLWHLTDFEYSFAKSLISALDHPCRFTDLKIRHCGQQSLGATSSTPHH